jgi:uncharacterized protein
MKVVSRSQVKLAFWAVAMGILAGSCSTGPSVPGAKGRHPASQKATSPKRGRMPIIDAHVHTKFSGKTDPDTEITYSKEGLLAEFEDNNIVGAVSMMARDGSGYDETLKQRGITFCVGINEKPNYTEIEDGLKSKKYGCIKIYLGYIHKFASDPIYKKAYELAEKYSVPVVFHTGDIYDVDGKLKYSDPMTIDEIAVDYRKVTFVIAHIGNPWIQTAAEVAYKNPNVYLEGSAILIGDLTRFSKREIEEQMVKSLRWVFSYIENPKKLMFGTDWPLVPIDQYLNVFFEAIPPQHWSAVFHDNAVRIYKLKRPLLIPDESTGVQ